MTQLRHNAWSNTTSIAFAVGSRRLDSRARAAPSVGLFLGNIKEAHAVCVAGD